MATNYNIYKSIYLFTDKDALVFLKWYAYFE